VSGRDTSADHDYLKRKILSLRLWENAQTGKAWDKSVMDMKYEVLIGRCGRAF
jgi:D-Tyr-tRNAtyr deacylase